MLAFGLALPVLPRLVEGFLEGDTVAAATVFGVFSFAFNLMQFLCAPVLGALSDRFGRRPVILLSNLGLALDHVLLALAPSLVWLLLGRIIAGGCAATVSTAFAYIADVTPPERRAKAMGLVGVAFGLGFVVGPAVGGLLGAGDPRLPFWVAAGLCFLNFLYGLLVLPESLPPERRAMRFAPRNANPFGAVRFLRGDAALMGLAAVSFLKHLSHVVLPVVFVLYAGYRYGWDATMLGFTLAVVGVCSATVQGLLVGPVVARFGERRALIMGLACGALGFAGFGLAPNAAWFWACLPVFALWDIANPALQALATRRVGPDRQGMLQGALGSLQGIAGLVGPFLFAGSFAFAIGAGAWLGLPGLPFLIAAALVGAAAVVAWRVAR
ncbi:MAG: TCR/Tet family MFS transporter [Acetobacteraceae bacterium]|nr:TCR/Tet family MFS transporter [Acetobacteraceae bacterium]